MQIQNDKIKKIQKVRENNNFLWCQLLDLCFKYSPQEAKEIFKKITENDKQINDLSKELCND